MSLLRCPLCAAPLVRLERTYACPGGHSFDISREGYVHLLPPNQMHSRLPGDDKAMAAARSRFLSGGYYAHLLEARASLMALDTRLSKCYRIMNLNPEGCFTTSTGRQVESGKAQEKLDKMAQRLGDLIDRENELLKGQIKKF